MLLGEMPLKKLFKEEKIIPAEEKVEYEAEAGAVKEKKKK